MLFLYLNSTYFCHPRPLFTLPTPFPTPRPSSPPTSCLSLYPICKSTYMALSFQGRSIWVDTTVSLLHSFPCEWHNYFFFFMTNKSPLCTPFFQSILLGVGLDPCSDCWEGKRSKPQLCRYPCATLTWSAPGMTRPCGCYTYSLLGHSTLISTVWSILLMHCGECHF